eukprot:scaffold161343_cov31-Tisochrysis_lutea.AAC.2
MRPASHSLPPKARATATRKTASGPIDGAATPTRKVPPGEQSTEPPLARIRAASFSELAAWSMVAKII